MLDINRLVRSFKFAFRGLASLVKHEQNFRVHILAAIVVFFCGVYFNIPIWQWCLIILMVACVWILEMMNTVFERLVDLFKPRLHPYVGEIKDIMSASVLVAALASALIGLLIFVPYVL
jgi:diacylglycerol kinase